MQQPKTQISKFFRIWIFALLFAITNIHNKPAWAFLSSVDQCLSQPQCAGVIAEELAPVIATPTAEAGGTTSMSAITATGVTTSSEAVAGVAVVGDVRLSGALAYHVWQSLQNGQAQDRAKQRYCEAYPKDIVCGASTSGQSPGVMYWAVATGVSIWNCQMLQASAGFQFEYCDDSSGFAHFYDLAHRRGSGITDLKGPVQFLGFRQALDQFNQGCWFMDVLTADGYRSEKQDCNRGPWFSPPGNLKFAGMLRMDGQVEPDSNQPPIPWKDWPQEKRSIAIAALKEPDWQEFIKSMPEGGRLNMGDQLKAPVIVLPGLDTDDPDTPIDERLAKKLPGSFTNPGLPGQFDFDDDGTDDDSDPEPQDPNVPTASSDAPPEPSPKPSSDQNGEQETWNPPRGNIPATWGDGEETNSGIGRRWVDPANKKANGVRIDKGNPNNSQTTQQVDHVVVRKDGKVIGRDGQTIQGSIKNNATNAHIPLQEWLTWSQWYAP